MIHIYCLGQTLSLLCKIMTDTSILSTASSMARWPPLSSPQYCAKVALVNLLDIVEWAKVRNAKVRNSQRIKREIWRKRVRNCGQMRNLKKRKSLKCESSECQLRIIIIPYSHLPLLFDKMSTGKSIRKKKAHSKNVKRKNVRTKTVKMAML